MIVWASIAPHGGGIVPELADGELELMAETRHAMEELGRRALRARPDTLVVITPHGLAMHGRLTVSVANVAFGALEGPGGTIGTVHEVDMEVALHLARAANELEVPIAVALVDENQRPAETFPMDFGAVIPLWFIGAHWRPRPRVVILCPDRRLSRKRLLRAGLATAMAAERSRKRVAIICSADHGHGHHEHGPYGYSPTSAEYDAAYCQAVEQNALGRLCRWRADWVESAMVDSYWQTLMLHGALSTGRFRSELLSYQAPTYFGMACAEFTPLD